MNPIKKLEKFLSRKEKDADTQLTNAEIEDNIQVNDEIVGFCIDYKLGLKFKDRYRTSDRYELPLDRNTKAFGSIEEMTEHIKRNFPAKERGDYFFDRNDEQVRDAVVKAFNEARCEKLKKEKRHAEKTLEEKEEKIEELCDE